MRKLHSQLSKVEHFPPIQRLGTREKIRQIINKKYKKLNRKKGKEKMLATDKAKCLN